MKSQSERTTTAATVEPDGLSDHGNIASEIESHSIGRRTVQEMKGWDVFRDPMSELNTSCTENRNCMEVLLRIIKVVIYLVVFVGVLCSSVVAKGTILLMTSQLRKGRTISYCNRLIELEKTFAVTLPDEERMTWIWCIIFSFAVPEVGTLIHSIRMYFFKSLKKPKVHQFTLVTAMETLHVVGLAIMFMNVLPELDIIRGAMLTNCVCFVPGLFGLLSRNTNCNETKRMVLILVDLAALAAQATAFVVWPLLDSSNRSLWLNPIALFLVSCGWWENYVSIRSPFSVIRSLGRIKEELRSTKQFTYIFVSVWKIVIFLCSTVVILHLKGENVMHLFTRFGIAFDDHNITVHGIATIIGERTMPDLTKVLSGEVTAIITTNFTAPLWVLLIQILSAYCSYVFGKFACKILIQGFSYALPFSFASLVSISLLVVACTWRDMDPCFFHGMLPDYLFYDSPDPSILSNSILHKYAWVWLLWLLSQIWITLHIWTPKCERLASTERLFVSPMYDGLLVNQSMALNRRRDDQTKVIQWSHVKRTEVASEKKSPYERPDIQATPLSGNKRNDHVTKIHACATMWHETNDEMLDFLKSILRMDQDQCARKNAKNFLEIEDPDYYEFETHVIFDDAFKISDDDFRKSQVNECVKRFINMVDQAATDVHHTRMHVQASNEHPTPYGARLVWTLPGKTVMTVHLKDRSKIRLKKRWSQVMYMYYILGYRIMDLPISIPRKEVIAENTYLLSLDGDVNFQPSAVQLLVDSLKKNADLGAACGRLHPVGSGPMMWYQSFEYAIIHWLQKAAEHVLGSVTCSPGCFSLFRAKALMDDNVLRRYTNDSTEAKNYVQHDQGEDRWLSTLLLQKGYRIDYSAASDAFTHTPNDFSEFFNQRRRWIPSTIANIMDLIMNYKRTTKNNDNISFPYIVYLILFMVITMFGPGMVFLVLIECFVSAFDFSIWTSLYWNLLPVLLFVAVCFTCQPDTQLQVAAVISAIYGLLMVVVSTSIFVEMFVNGWNSPGSLLLSLLTGVVAITGLMHPKELHCLPYGFIYYLAVPSTHLLLIIYSIINVNDPSWGTREVEVKKTSAESQKEKKEVKTAKGPTTKKLLGSDPQNGNKTIQTSVEFSSPLFNCVLYNYGETSDREDGLVAIEDSSDDIIKRLDIMEGRELVAESPLAEDPVVTDQPVHSDTDTSVNLITDVDYEPNIFDLSPRRLKDENIEEWEVNFLPPREEQFWNDFIAEYLSPVKKHDLNKERIASDLKNFRNNSSLAFLIMNALFVLMVFWMQLHKDTINIRWPSGDNNTVPYDMHSREVQITNGYFQLEPIGLIFVILFIPIIAVQFIAMMIHRLGTFTHIIASTKLQDCHLRNRPGDRSNEPTLQKKDRIAIVKDLQRPESDNDNGDKESVNPVR